MNGSNKINQLCWSDGDKLADYQIMVWWGAARDDGKAYFICFEVIVGG